MPVLVPATVDEALAALSRQPGSQLLAGGTDFMVEVNAGGRRPDSVIALDRVAELRGWSTFSEGNGTRLRLGAGVTYRELMTPELARLVPALATAARTVGSPQIRNAGTIGGNIGTGSPAGDTLPVLIALDAVVDVAGASGARRHVPLAELIVGPKRTSLRPDELIAAVEVPVLRGGQEYLKVGVRNAMVIAVASLALIADFDGRTVRCGLGSVGPIPLRARDAEAWLANQIDWDEGRLGRADATHFAAMVADAARPIDDHRSTAAYRRHAVAVMARRAVARLFPE